MNKSLMVLVTIIDSVALPLLAILIGFWWIPELSRDGQSAASSRATWLLLIFVIYFYKSIVRKKEKLPKFILCFAWSTATIALVGYVFGFFLG